MKMMKEIFLFACTYASVPVLGFVPGRPRSFTQRSKLSSPLAAAKEGAIDMPIHSLMDQINPLNPSRGPRDALLVSGNIRAILAKLSTRAVPALLQVMSIVDPLDLAIILVVSFGTTSILRIFNSKILNGIVRRKNPKEFVNSKLRVVGDTICQLGQCAFVSYLGEIVVAFLDVLGWHLPPSAPRFLTITTYSVWLASRLSVVKSRLLDTVFNAYGQSKSPVTGITKVFYNRFLDLAIQLLAVIAILDFNNIRVGVVFKSLLSIAGISSLLFGLALRDPATQVIQGTSLLLRDRFSPGEKIKLADGTIGRVLDIGWLDTTLQGRDDIEIRIPNSEIAGKRIYNISRMKRSRVKQKLRFRYDDIDKMQKLTDDIKKDIRVDCPDLIVDGSRPFRVHWRAFDTDHISVVVDAHFEIKPTTNEFYDNQEKVLIAIARAAKENGMKFALPSRISLREKM